MSWKKYLRITFFIHKVAGLLCKVVGMKWDNIYKWAEWIVYKEKVWLFISWLHNRHYCVKESAPMTSKIHRCSFLSQLTAYPFSFLGFFFSCLELPDSFSSFSLIMLASFLTWHSFSVWSFWWFPINIRIVTPTIVAHDSLETIVCLPIWLHGDLWKPSEQKTSLFINCVSQCKVVFSTSVACLFHTEPMLVKYESVDDGYRYSSLRHYATTPLTKLGCKPLTKQTISVIGSMSLVMSHTVMVGQWQTRCMTDYNKAGKWPHGCWCCHTCFCNKTLESKHATLTVV